MRTRSAAKATAMSHTNGVTKRRSIYSFAQGGAGLLRVLLELLRDLRPRLFEQHLLNQRTATDEDCLLNGRKCTMQNDSLRSWSPQCGRAGCAECGTSWALPKATQAALARGTKANESEVQHRAQRTDAARRTAMHTLVEDFDAQLAQQLELRAAVTK
jgi:hypothetical protein